MTPAATSLNPDPALAAILALFRRPSMPSPDVRFALVRGPTNPLARPQPCVTLGELARAVDRDRKGAPIQCVDNTPLDVADWGELRGVGIWTLTPAGDHDRYIDWAWMNGAGLTALEAALTAYVVMRGAGRAA